jgi:hypothetical protein
MATATKNWLHRALSETGFLAVCLLAAAAFVLQAWNLDQTAAPFTDEGVYAEAGRLIMSGHVPYSDFLLVHMPLLPLFIGFFLKLTSSLFATRLIYCALNCASAVLLFQVLVRIRPNQFFAFIACCFYLTYQTMVSHDCRFMAIRQFSNIFVITFMFLLDSRFDNSRVALTARSLIYLLGGFTFLPTLPGMTLLQLGTFWDRSDKTRKKLLNIVMNPFLASLALGAFFYFIPQAFEQVVAFQKTRPYLEMAVRFQWIWDYSRSDLLLYAIGLAGLCFSILKPKVALGYAIALLGIICINFFVPRGYYPHYLVGAAPAFAVGAFLLLAQVENLFGPKWKMKLQFASLAVLSAHLYIVTPGLWKEWIGNESGGYKKLVSILHEMPGPLLAMEPIYAVDAGIPLVSHFNQADMRVYRVTGEAFPEDKLSDLESRACTLLLEPYFTRSFLPKAVIERWMTQYSTVYNDWWGTILVSNRPDCQSVDASHARVENHLGERI